MKTRQNTIEKYHKFLKDLSLTARNGEINNVSDIVRDYSLNSYTPSVMLKLGYIKKIGKQKHKLLLMNPEPKHARELIEFMNQARQKHKSVASVKKPSKQKVITSRKASKPAASTSSQREFSVLWGLIKVKF
jgi:DNA-binding transcriptional regulator WhiA